MGSQCHFGVISACDLDLVMAQCDLGKEPYFLSSLLPMFLGQPFGGEEQNETLTVVPRKSREGISDDL